MFKSFLLAFSTAFLCTPLFLIGIHIAGAQVMQSSNYQIQSDSINMGGGFSSSTNYVLESTSGEVATGESSSASYALKAGYQQMQEVYIAISGTSAITLSPSIPGVSGGNAYASTTITVITDNSTGYQLTILASNDPAMQKGADSIADYDSGGNPDFSFLTGSSDAHFGYTPEGTDIVQRFLDDGGLCNAGIGDTVSACWDGVSTTAEIIASNNNPNHPNGATTTVRFQVGIGSSVVQAPGTYVATTTLTATAL